MQDLSSKTSNNSQNIWLALVVLVMAQIGTSADNSVLGVATSSLLSSLNASMSDIALANIIYSLCAGALMIVGGLLGLILGWRTIFRLGAFFCILGELVIAFSPNMMIFSWVGRLGVGLGASLMIPAVLAQIAGIYVGTNRAIAFGAIGAATGIATMAGPLLAGVLIQSFNWRIAFGFMAFYFLLVLLGSFLIPLVKKPERKIRFDFLGSAIAIAGLFLLIIGISKVTNWGLISPIHAPFLILGISPALPLAFLGILILIFLVFIEGKIEAKYGSCLIPKSFLKTPQVRAGIYLNALLFLCFGGAFFLIVTYMQVVLNYSAVFSGVAMASMAIPLIVFSLGMPKFFPTASPKFVVRFAIILLIIASVIMANSFHTYSISFWLYVGLAIFGVGQGLIASQNSNIVSLAVSNEDAQQSGGVQVASRNIGQAIGVAILGVAMLFSITGGLQSKVSSSEFSQETKDFINSFKAISFVNDDTFRNVISKSVSSQKEQDLLVELNAKARLQSTSLSIYVMGFIILIFIFGTGSIPTRKELLEQLQRRN